MGKKKKQFTIKSIQINKLVHGGQGLAEFDDGKKVFAWGGLPGEDVSVLVSKSKKTYVEGVVTEVHKASKDRIEPEEPESYLSTSPWQIMSFQAENEAKQEILEETYKREGIDSIKFEPFVYGKNQFGYRNKMEMGFWGDDNGLHLAHYVRGSHGKAIVQGSALAMNCINKAAQDVRDELKRLDVWGGKLKTIVLRASETSEVVVALFIKEELDLKSFNLPESLKGMEIYYSDPKSPASLPSKKLYSFGDITLTDTISGKNITYDVMSFFQVNLPMFELALKEIKRLIRGTNIVDMYSGVGTIGIAVGATKLVESDLNNVKMALINVKATDIEVIHATSETALDSITSESTLIVDPPRAGLHKDVITRIIESKPKQIIYLSCNPITQARDIKLIEQIYNIKYAQGFNFFPRTPHIESLIVLELK
jgi:23S rRNA (uracil1939-C5)-methyltransferase